MQTVCSHYVNNESTNSCIQEQSPRLPLLPISDDDNDNFDNSHIEKTNTPVSFYSDNDPSPYCLNENIPSRPTDPNYNVHVHVSTNNDSHVLCSNENTETSHRLKIGTINVCGLKSKMNYPEFTKFIEQYDIVCILETKLDKYDKIEMPNYTFLSKPRTDEYKRKSGGIGFFINNSLSANVVTLDSDCEYVFWLKTLDKFVNQNEIVLGALYIPPETSKFYNNDEIFLLENDINAKCTQFENVIITGDANGHTSNLPDFSEFDNFLSEHFELDTVTTSSFDSCHKLSELNIPLYRKSQCNKVNRLGTKLLDICKHNNLFILNGRMGKDKDIGKFTFRDISVIDYSLASPNMLGSIEAFDIIELDPMFSDGHSLLYMELKITPRLTTEQAPNYNPELRPPKWKDEKKNDFIQNIDPTKISEIENMFNNQPTLTVKAFLNDVTEKISHLFVNTARSTFPTPTRYTHSDRPHPSNKPWFGPHCKRARNAYHYARKAYQLNRCEVNKLKLRKISKEYKQTINKYVRKHKFSTENKLRKMSSTKPKDYWKLLNSINKTKQDKSPSIENFFDHYEKTNNSINHESVQDQLEADDTYTPYIHTIDSLNTPITHAEIAKAISKSKNNKSPSQHDYILNEYMKCTQTEMSQIYYKLFNMVLDTGVLPETWLIGTIKPIYKNKGSVEDASNYRPITILSCLGKIFTAILNERVYRFLNDNNMLSENQAGFRSGYSTCEHIFALNFLIQKLKSQKKKLFCSFIDFSAAFDSIWRAGLWYKISKIGVRGKIFTVIQNMYSDIKSCVVNNGKTSRMFSSFCGVRQGENLSRILFSMYLNDLEDFLKTSCNGMELNITIDETTYFLKLLVLLYADDTIIFSDNKKDLQKCLDSFSIYCKKWKLNVNYSKTKVLVFGSRNTSNFSFTINNQPIETTNEYKYLGVLFTSSGAFSKCRKHLTSQANKAMFQLFVRTNNLNLPIYLQLKLFDHTVMPILTYGCEIWGYENLDILEEFHCNFLRRITKTKKSTPRYMLYAELSRLPIEIFIKTRMIKFWTTILQSKPTKFSHLIYRYMSQENQNYRWINHIKGILDFTGYSYLWLNQTTITGYSTHKLIKDRLIDHFKQDWFSKLNNSSKGRMYSIYKDNINLENYLLNLPPILRLNMLHFRTGNHRLPVEVGRWNRSRIPLENRKCPLCTLNDTGDEMHYLLICPHFQTLRRKLIPAHFFQRPNIILFKNLMCITEPPTLSNLATFMKLIIREFNRRV